MLKNTPVCQFWPIFWYKTVNNSWTKKDIRNRYQCTGEKMIKRKWAKFQERFKRPFRYHPHGYDWESIGQLMMTQSIETSCQNRLLWSRKHPRVSYSVSNFKTKALALRKLKGKENCENEHREKAKFQYNFVQKANATEQLRWHFRPTSQRDFFRQFSPIDPYQIELSEETKKWFSSKSNF